ncbi:MAG: Rrf2 family transcriptional regulator [Planctomycetes bacterium]|nr:Rrf2 family transcriptional regulator [Planctomycetota bacterium]MBL7007824.1 Rrf2 family transcriptional regulator [Planctomycetota bacterium]
MLRLTKRSEYGLMALAYLAARPGVYCSVREIVARLGTPRRLLAEVLKALSQAKVVEATRGPGGGYRLKRPAEELSLTLVISILEGPIQVARCASDNGCDFQDICTIQEGIGEVAAKIQTVLDAYTLADVVRARDEKLAGSSATIGAPQSRLAAEA